MLYGAYIWFELFGRSQPRSLGYVLVAYTAVNFAAAAIVGKEAWFRYGEFFAVLFRLAGHSELAGLRHARTTAVPDNRQVSSR